LDLDKLAEYKFKTTATDKLQAIAKQIADKKAPIKEKKIKTGGGC